MTDVKIFDQLVETAAEVFGVSPSAITADLKAGDIEEWDSLGHLKLFMAVEEKWKVKFTTEEIVALSSLEVIAKRLAEKTAS